MFLLTATLDTFGKWLSAICAFLFVSVATFLRVSPACELECLFSGAIAFSAHPCIQFCVQIWCHRKSAVSNRLTHAILFVSQCVPLDTGCRSSPHLHSTKYIRCGPDGPRFFMLGVPSLVKTNVHPTKRFPITRSGDIPRYNMYLALWPYEILSR